MFFLFTGTVRQWLAVATRENKSVSCSLVATDGSGVYSGVGAVRNEVHHSLKAKAEEVTCVTIL